MPSTTTHCICHVSVPTWKTYSRKEPCAQLFMHFQGVYHNTFHAWWMVPVGRYVTVTGFLTSVCKIAIPECNTENLAMDGAHCGWNLTACAVHQMHTLLYDTLEKWPPLSTSQQWPPMTVQPVDTATVCHLSMHNTTQQNTKRCIIYSTCI